MEKEILLNNLDKIHTTKLGIERIKKNLNIHCDAILYCKDIIKSDSSAVQAVGKNYYIKNDDCVITVNKSSFTIITAHKLSH